RGDLFSGVYGDVHHLVLTIAAEERKPLQVIMIQQKRAEKSGGKMNDIAVHSRPEIPAMYLSGYHEIDLERLYGKGGEVDRMGAAAAGEHSQVIEIMSVLRMYFLIVLMQVVVQPLHQQVLLMMAFADAANIVYRDGCFHDSTKVRRSGSAANGDLWILWYFLPIGGS